MNTKMTLALALSSALLTACGGGGGSSSDTANNLTSTETPVEAASIVETPEPEPEEPAAGPVTEVTSTSDLVASDTFLFKSSYSASFDIDVASSYDYVTVCDAIEEDMPNYANCQFRAELVDGEANRELLLTNDTDRLIVTLWDFEAPNAPVHHTWNRDLSGDRFVVN